MQHKFSQQQKIFQKMVLTPQMRQSLKLLSMSINDLNEYIDAVITGNPFIQKLIDMKTRGRYEMGPAAGMAVVHACFIVVFSLFVYSLAQSALRLRDANLGS